MANKRNRQWVLGTLVVVLTVMVWWINYYSPLLTRTSDMEAEYSLLIDKKMRIKKKIAELEKKYAENMIYDAEVESFAKYMISGKDLEELNAVIQQKIQVFMEEKEIPLSKYQVLKPGKWRDYDIGILEFTVKTTHQGIADLLIYLENLQQLVRIGRLNINYNRSGSKSSGNNLRITFRLETLFVDKG